MNRNESPLRFSFLAGIASSVDHPAISRLAIEIIKVVTLTVVGVSFVAGGIGDGVVQGFNLNVQRVAPADDHSYKLKDCHSGPMLLHKMYPRPYEHIVGFNSHEDFAVDEPHHSSTAAESDGKTTATITAAANTESEKAGTTASPSKSKSKSASKIDTHRHNCDHIFGRNITKIHRFYDLVCQHCPYGFSSNVKLGEHQLIPSPEKGKQISVQFIQTTKQYVLYNKYKK